jgi:hypothetical protein
LSAWQSSFSPDSLDLPVFTKLLSALPNLK